MRRITFIGLLGAIGAIGTFPASAQDEDWHYVTSTSDGSSDYSIKFGSGARGQNNKGETITVVVGRVTHKDKSQIDLQKWYVTDRDCAQEYGQLNVLDLDGSFKHDAPYAKGSETVASAIAELICLVGQASVKEAVDKSI